MKRAHRDAPYAPTRSIRLILAADRRRRLREPIHAGRLEALGIPRTMIARTVHALSFLDLVTDGQRTERLDELQNADRTELPRQLGRMVHDAYGQILGQLDPNAADDRSVERAFENCQPARQRPRMISLLRGLADDSRMVEAIAPIASRVPGARVPSGASSAGPADGVERPVHPLLISLLGELPAGARWPAEERKRWLAAWTAAIDFLWRSEGPPLDQPTA